MDANQLVERVARALDPACWIAPLVGARPFCTIDPAIRRDASLQKARAALLEIVAAAGGENEKGPRRALLRGATVIEAHDHGCEPSSGDTAALLRALADVE